MVYEYACSLLDLINAGVEDAKDLFTQEDIECATKYYVTDFGHFMTLERIEKMTDIKFPRNKRNGRDQETHLQKYIPAMRSIGDVKDTRFGVEGGNELMKNCPLSLLKTEYTHMAHHGQNGVSKEFYDYINPKKCIWPSPNWLWNNDAGNGYDTGPWQTVRTREWVAALGVTEHIVEKDGIQKLNF